MGATVVVGAAVAGAAVVLVGAMVLPCALTRCRCGESSAVKGTSTDKKICILFMFLILFLIKVKQILCVEKKTKKSL